MKNHLSVIIVLIFLISLGSDSIGATYNQDSLKVSSYQINLLKVQLDSINLTLERINKNTKPTKLNESDFDEYANLILGLVASIGTFLTVLVIHLDTRQRRLNKEFHDQLLKGILRHFYRNMAILGAIKIHLKENYNNFYPSEEHILKFKVPPENLRLNQVSHSAKYYSKLHILEIQMRNFNIEVDVAISHLRIEKLSEEIKKRDLDLLEFKISMLSHSIVDLLITLSKSIQSIDDVRMELNKISEENRKQKKSVTPEAGKVIEVPERVKGDYFDSIAPDVKSNLDNDVILEYPVINNIPFFKT